MRQLPWIILGALVGFLAGGVGPRRQLAQQDLAHALALEEAADATRSPRRSLGATPLPALDEAFASRPSRVRPSAEAPSTDGSPRPDTGFGSAEVVTAGEPQDMLEAYDLAVDAQRLRAEQSRAALAEQADLDSEQLADVDAVVADMNAALAAHAEDLLDLALAGGEPDTTELLGITHDVTGILYESQVALEDIVGVEALDEVEPSATEVWNYVDLDEFRGAVEEAQDAGEFDDWDGRPGGRGGR